MSSAITKNLKTAFFSALLVVAVAYPVLGLKLTTVGIKLEVHNASPAVLWTIAGCAIAMFFWQLFRDQISSAWSHAPKLPAVPSKATNFLTLPSTQRWIILGLVVVALVVAVVIFIWERRSSSGIGGNSCSCCCCSS